MALGTLYGLGYSKAKTVDDFKNLIDGAPIELMIDIRYRPRSRFRPDWNGKKASEFTVLTAGVPRYLHLEGLGNPNYSAGLPARLADPGAINIVEDELEAGVNVALLCVDQFEAECHRRLIIKELRKRHPDLEVVRLGE